MLYKHPSERLIASLIKQYPELEQLAGSHAGAVYVVDQLYEHGRRYNDKFAQAYVKCALDDLRELGKTTYEVGAPSTLEIPKFLRDLLIHARYADVCFELEIRLPDYVGRIAFELRREGAYPMLVGGCVRDAAIDPGKTPKDIDIECYGAPVENIIRALQTVGNVNAVGASFGVLKVRTPEGYELDVSLPRTESKQGSGHRGFVVQPDPSLSIKAATYRRDFTINSLLYDPLLKIGVDYYGGLKDLQAGVLRHTGPAFAEDPLRVLRGIQFAARMNLRIAPETAELCRSLSGEYQYLAAERVLGEWNRLLLKGHKPSAGIGVLKETGWIAHFPELANLRGVPQSPKYHPEGAVDVHTEHVLDYMTLICERDGIDGDQRLWLMYAALCHDFGKATHTQIADDGSITSKGHEDASVPLAESFLKRLRVPTHIVMRVLPLVREHMAPASLPPGTEPSNRAVASLSRRLAPATIEDLERVVEADASGRPPLPARRPALHWMEKARNLGVQDSIEQDIMLGRHVLDMLDGELPINDRKWIGEVLREARQAQESGEFTDLEGGINWLRNRLRSLGRIRD